MDSTGIGTVLDLGVSVHHQVALEPAVVLLDVLDRQHDARVEREVARLATRGIGTEEDLVIVHEHPHDGHLR